MNITDIEVGMMLRVHTDISTTKDKWTLDDEGFMKQMRSKTYKVVSVRKSRDGVTLDDTESGETWIFSSTDLSKTKISKPIPPVIFDPTNLCE